jgi:hypothetical protein
MNYQQNLLKDIDFLKDKFKFYFDKYNQADSLAREFLLEFII